MRILRRFFSHVHRGLAPRGNDARKILPRTRSRGAVTVIFPIERFLPARPCRCKLACPTRLKKNRASVSRCSEGQCLSRACIGFCVDRSSGPCGGDAVAGEHAAALVPLPPSLGRGRLMFASPPILAVVRTNAAVHVARKGRGAGFVLSG